MEPITKHLRIKGRVQGVRYRIEMNGAAAALGITGWVRNRSDGSVEAVVSGSSEAVDKIIAWARKGPRSAEVITVDVTPAEGDYRDFGTRPTE